MTLDVNRLWNYGQPALSESRFREALAGAAPDDALILQTQIARTFGLRKDFAQARRILAEIEPQLAAASPEARVRHALELGRTYASPAHPAGAVTAEDRERAGSLYLQAFEIAAAASLDALAVDALHMMPIVETAPELQLAWDEKAIAHMEQSTQPDAKRWEAALRNNVGYARHLLGEYDEALRQYGLSLAAHERAGNAGSVRIAHWMIASTYRAQKRYGEALAIQLRLEREFDAAGEPDPFVFEELEQLHRALGDEAKAAHYRARLDATKSGA